MKVIAAVSVTPTEFFAECNKASAGSSNWLSAITGPESEQHYKDLFAIFAPLNAKSNPVTAKKSEDPAPTTTNPPVEIKTPPIVLTKAIDTGKPEVKNDSRPIIFLAYQKQEIAPAVKNHLTVFPYFKWWEAMSTGNRQNAK